ncbi:hypothetical protein B0H19DRAFT_1229374 [Mycena capillaripes]|nr:hypothetical protein B0H19DRAFT_1229374 [Mycena capillaripes]
MSPPSWATDEQTKFLHAQLPVYLKARENQQKVPLRRFWNRLEEGFFALWPAELSVDLPLPTPGSDPLTEAEAKKLGHATDVTQKRLKAWMRYQDALHNQGNAAVPSSGPGPRNKKRSLFRLLKNSAKATRPKRSIEMYQRLYKGKIKDMVLMRGYGNLNEEAEEPGSVVAEVMTEQDLASAELEADLLAIQRVQKNRAARMSMWRTTSLEMYGAESDGVKQEVEAATAVENEKRAETGDDDGEKTPEELQHGIDQIGAVYSKVHQATMEETGWFGITLVGGPMPRRGGQISTKTICFGVTPHGNDFAASAFNFEEIKSAFQQWLKRAFPHEVRDARGIPLPGAGDAASDPLDDLISMDDQIPLHSTAAKISKKSPKTPPAPAPLPSIAVVATAFAPAVAVPTGISDAPPTAPPPINSAPANADAPPTSFLSSDITASPPVFCLRSFPSNDQLAFPPSDFDEVMASTTSSDVDLHTNISWDDDNAYMGEDNTNPFITAIPALRPAPRPIHSGAAFTQDREVGGTPGRAPQFKTVEVGGFNFPTSEYRPSTLFQVFTKNPARSPTSVFGSHPLPSSSSTFQPSTTTSTLSRMTSLNDWPIHEITNATPPSVLPSTTTLTTPALIATPAAVPPFTNQPAFSFTNARSRGPPGPRQSALQTFSSAVANATTAVQLSLTPALDVAVSAPTSPAPQYIESRPMANVPKGHALAPVHKPRKKAAPKKKAPAKRRGRPPTTATPVNDDENTPTPLTRAESAALTARSEAARQRRQDAANRELRADVLQREKAMVERTTAAEAEVKHLQALCHNPAGNADLFVTSARPKRAILATKNTDGSDIIRQVKRTRLQLAALAEAEDQRILDGFTRQAVAAADTMKKKRKAAAPTAGAAAPNHLIYHAKKRGDISSPFHSAFGSEISGKVHWVRYSTTEGLREEEQRGRGDEPESLYEVWLGRGVLPLVLEAAWKSGSAWREGRRGADEGRDYGAKNSGHSSEGHIRSVHCAHRVGQVLEGSAKEQERTAGRSAWWEGRRGAVEEAGLQRQKHEGRYTGTYAGCIQCACQAGRMLEGGRKQPEQEQQHGAVRQAEYDHRGTGNNTQGILKFLYGMRRAGRGGGGRDAQ